MSPIRAAVPTAEEVSALLAGVWRTVDTETDAVAAELAGDESDAVLLDRRDTVRVRLRRQRTAGTDRVVPPGAGTGGRCFSRCTAG